METTGTTHPPPGGTLRRAGVARRRRLDQGLSAAVLLLAGSALLGWALDVERLERFSGRFDPIAPTTALALCLLALASLWPRARVTTAGIVLVLAAWSLTEHALGSDLLLDSWVEALLDAGAGPSPGRMAISSSVCLGLLAAGRLLAHRHCAWAEALAASAYLLALLAVLGFAYGLTSLYAVPFYEGTALRSSVALLLMAVATLVEVPQGRLVWVVTGDDPGALLMRRMLPLAVLGLPAVGLLRMEGETLGWYSTPFGLAVMVTLSSTLVLVVSFLAASRLRRLDQERTALLDQSRRMGQDLERLVDERSVELAQERTKVALYEDRQRIASDVHDHVLQRIFATGLLLRRAHVTRGAGGLGLEDTIGEVEVELDSAVRDLRAIIFGLKTHVTSDGIEATLRGAVERSRRILGFTPELETGGELDGLDLVVGEMMLAVVVEGLSNVARHARAGWASVSATVADGHVRLEVADDGRGMPERLPHTGGLDIIRTRAELVGGSARWERRTGGGTRLVWEVPVDGVRTGARGVGPA